VALARDGSHEVITHSFTRRISSHQNMASELKIGTPVALFTGIEENLLCIEGSSAVAGHKKEQNNHCVTTEEKGYRLRGESKGQR
jgi:hypothetical protein